MAKNNIVSSLDLGLTQAELKSMVSDVSVSMAYVVDTNHDGNGNDELQIGEVIAKSLGDAGTSELMDSVFKPINSNITHYPLAGEFILTLTTPFGKFYLSAVNLFGDSSSNIDTDNASGYTRFTDDESTNRKQIASDRKTQKSVLDNNEPPFNTLDIPSRSPTFVNRFGDVGLTGRYGNKISLTRSTSTLLPEMIFENGITNIQLTNGSFTYIRSVNVAEANPTVNRKVTKEYLGEQVYADSQRFFANIGDEGIFWESSGLISLLSDDTIYINSADDIEVEGSRINLGSEADERAVQGDSYFDDFERLVESMIRFAETLKAQDKILALSNAANNFLTDIENIGWNNFNKDNYLSEKVHIE